MINLKKKILELYFRSTFIIFSLIIIFSTVQELYALSPNWVSVPSSKYGDQFWDKRSVKRNADGSVRVMSKFIPKDKSEIIDDILYTMDINCFEKSFRDVAITTNQDNQFTNKNLDWEHPNGDKLIIGIISQVCKYED